ncbi:hypothetical protein SAMN05428954_6800 [Streptomyces sp. 2112.3]|nr:hypothetical protein SAMN05428954_6800 [Streptomyces sp. 2112.3]
MSGWATYVRGPTHRMHGPTPRMRGFASRDGFHVRKGDGAMAGAVGDSPWQAMADREVA